MLDIQGYNSFNVSDVFNSRKRRSETNLPSVSNYSEVNGEKTIQFVIYVSIE
jgi:hypothetical protein